MHNPGPPPIKVKREGPLHKRIRDGLHDFFDALRNTPQAFKLVWAASRASAIIGILLTLIAAALPAAQAWAGKLIIDAIVEAAAQKLTMLEGTHLVMPFLLLEFGLVLVSSVTGQLRSLSDSILRAQLANHINSMVINKAITLDLQFFENPVFYDMLQNARRQADSSALSIVNAILQVLQQVITLVSLILLLVRFSPWIAVIVFLAAIPSFLSQSQFAERAFRTVTHRAPENRLLNYLESLLTGSETVKEIKLFGLGKPLLKRYGTLFTKFYQEDKTLAIKTHLCRAGMGSALECGVLRQLCVDHPAGGGQRHHPGRYDHVPGAFQAIAKLDPLIVG